MKRIFLYQHGGSENHGCEALVRTVTEILKKTMEAEVTLCSNAVEQDRKYGLDRTVRLVQNQQIMKRWSPQWMLYQADKRFFHHAALEERLLTEKVCLREAAKADLSIAIGGDNYCYHKGRQFWPTDRRLKKEGRRLVLWGCSLEPQDLDEEFVRQLCCFDLLTVRESLSFEALQRAGMPADKIRLIPDPAFTLEPLEKRLPRHFEAENTVGINVSPMIIGCEQEKGAVMENYRALIQHILKTTDFQVALIPHVVWPYNDDREPLQSLFDQFEKTGRMVLIEDADCRVLKGFISRLRLFIGARTHATIAAYSMGVPTLAVGYSVKAEGIARDLFGDGFSQEEQKNFVLSVQRLREPDQLTSAFDWLYEHEIPIRQHLAQKMPAYRQKAWEAGDAVKGLLES